MVPSSATAGVPQLLHFPLNVDIWTEGAGLIRGCGSVVVVLGVCWACDLDLNFKTKKNDKNGY